MKLSLKNKIIASTFFVFIVSSVLFTNCSRSKFTSVGAVDGFSGPQLLIEDGRYATNKKILKIEFVGLDLYHKYTEMKIGFEQDFNANNFSNKQYIGFKKTLEFDLEAEFAGDGAKDRFKNLVAVLRGADGKELFLQSKILLDTIVPKIEGLDFLKNGLSGQNFSPGQKVSVQWSAEDPAAPSGSKSGLINLPIQVGWSNTADCSQSNQKFLSNELSHSGYFGDFIWPQKNEFDAFYICLYGKDQAGNVGTYLSQPLTQLWKVIIGENNLGNGGSIYSSSVRFNFLNDLAVDQKGQLFISDNFYGNLRFVDTNGIITTIFGNGSPEADPKKNMAYSCISMDTDLNNNLYCLVNGGRIDKIFFNDQTNKWTITTIQPGISGGLTSIHIRKNKNVSQGDEELYLSHYNTVAENIAVSSARESINNYIFKLKLSDLNSNLDLAKLKQSYKFIGNGSTFMNGDNSPYSQIVGQERMGYPWKVFVDVNDDVYFSTCADGSGRPYGEHSVRLVKKNANGQLMNYKLSSEPWVTGLSLFSKGTEKHLIVSSVYSVFAYPTNKIYTKLTNLQSLVEADKERPWGESNITGSSKASVVKKSLSGDTGDVLYVAHTMGSQVVEINNQMQIVAKYGRKPFDQVAQPLKTALNNPASVIQDKNNNIIFVDTMSCLIRKMNSQNQMQVLSGESCSTNEKQLGQEVTSNMSALSGLSAYSVGYSNQAVYDNAKNHFWVSAGNSGALIKYDLNAKSSEVYKWGNPSDLSNTSGWPIYNITLDKSGPDTHIYLSRYLTINPFRQIVEKWNTNNLQNPSAVIGNGQIGATTANSSSLNTALSNAIANEVDQASGDFYFVTEGVRLFKNKNQVNVPVANLKNTAQYMKIFYNNNKINFITTNHAGSVNHVVLNSAGTAVESDNQLCFPGSFLNSAESISFANDKNILIADTKNNRILKYNIFNVNTQSYNFKYCN